MCIYANIYLLVCCELLIMCTNIIFKTNLTIYLISILTNWQTEQTNIRQLKKGLWKMEKMEKMLMMSNFSISLNLFYIIRELKVIYTKF